MTISLELERAAGLLAGRVSRTSRGWRQVDGAWHGRPVRIRAHARLALAWDRWDVQIAMRPARIPDGADAYWPTPSTELHQGLVYYNPHGRVWVRHADLFSDRFTERSWDAVFEELRRGAEQVERGA
jgi:hypothetical protein